jgi:hypothetical protein
MLMEMMEGHANAYGNDERFGMSMEKMKGCESVQ